MCIQSLCFHLPGNLLCIAAHHICFTFWKIFSLLKRSFSLLFGEKLQCSWSSLYLTTNKWRQRKNTQGAPNFKATSCCPESRIWFLSSFIILRIGRPSSGDKQWLRDIWGEMQKREKSEGPLYQIAHKSKIWTNLESYFESKSSTDNRPISILKVSCILT